MIRLLTDDDLEEVLALGALMHEESVFRHFDFDEEKCRNLIRRFTSNSDTHFACLSESGGVVTGMFAGSISEHYFGRDLIASDTLWYVLPEHRGSRAGLQLLRAFEKWAKARNAAEIFVGVSTGLGMDRTGGMLQKLGYDVVGGNFKLRVVG
jgi:GNAT superfamily N-acetyltransferase